MLIATGAIRL